MTTVVRRDLIAIGCSAGGVLALPIVLENLPSDLPAAVIVVQHLMSGSELVDIVQRHSRLPVAWAEQGDLVVPGRVYIAPADAHLLLIDSHLRLDRGPRENHARPAIDRTFRSAAALYGPRAIGVVMTGMLDDGVIGLAAIRACGGYAIVEDPATAAYPDLPAQALALAGADAVVPLPRIAPAIVAALAEPAVPRDVPRPIALEAELDRHPVDPGVLDLIGARASLPRHDEELARAMSIAIHALRDRAALFEALMHDAEATSNRIAAAAYGDRAREAVESAETVRRFLLELGAGCSVTRRERSR